MAARARGHDVADVTLLITTKTITESPTCRSRGSLAGEATSGS
jgi:hypothetical protein